MGLEWWWVHWSTRGLWNTSSYENTLWTTLTSNSQENERQLEIIDSKWPRPPYQGEISKERFHRWECIKCFPSTLRRRNLKTQHLHRNVGVFEKFRLQFFSFWFRRSVNGVCTRWQIQRKNSSVQDSGNYRLPSSELSRFWGSGWNVPKMLNKP